MPTLAEKIDNILILGQKAYKKEEKDNIIKMLSNLSKDYSSEEYPKMSIDKFMSSDVTKAGITPKEMLESYYGKALPEEIIRAGNYNINHPTVANSSFSNIFDTIKAKKDTEYGSSYDVIDNIPTAIVSSGTGAKIDEENSNTYREWLAGNDPELKARAMEFFQVNSIDPSIPSPTGISPLKHEIGHHISQADISASLPINTQRQGFLASNYGIDFGLHTNIKNETTQALSRLQRELFKEKGSRITNPADFMKLVNSGEIPEFLTQEGRRILIYAKNLKNVKDTSKDEEKKKAAAEALKGLSEMAPAVVQNKKKIGLNFNIA
jgi:hypothetical protein